MGPGLSFWNPMDRGWIKIWRCFKDNAYSNKPDYVAIWFHMLLLATHKPKRIFIGGKTIDLKPGQFATSRKSLSGVSGVSEMKTERLLSRLEIEQQIEQQSFSKFRIITITNWDKYQNSEQQIEQQMHSSCTGTAQELNTIKNKRSKEVKNENTLHHFANEVDDESRLRKPKKGRSAPLSDWMKAMGNGLRTWFENEWWPEQLRKVGKKECIMALYALNPDEELRHRILSSYRTQLNSDYQHRELDKVPHPATWINGSRWEDEGKKPIRSQSATKREMIPERRDGNRVTVDDGFGNPSTYIEGETEYYRPRNSFDDEEE